MLKLKSICGWFGWALFLFSCATLAKDNKTGVVRTTRETLMIRPIGFVDLKQPPTEAVVFMDKVEVGFSAEQVCGYTDWSTLAIELPKQLLTKDYWENLGGSLHNAAKDLVISISNALPAMLACNASPTFCNIMNHAQTLAQAEGKFTFDTCEALDGLANSSYLQSEPLRMCIQSKTSNKSISPSEAREQCILGSSGTGQSKAEKTANAGGGSGGYYNENFFANYLCRERSMYKLPIHRAYAYSVSEEACRFATGIPGIRLEAKASIRNEGSYRSIGQQKYVAEKNRTEAYLLELAEMMRKIRYGLSPYNGAGPLPPEKVIEHPAVKQKMGILKNGQYTWQASKGQEPIASCMSKYDPALKRKKTEAECRLEAVPPIYRLGSEGAEPTLLVHPMMIAELADVLPDDVSSMEKFKYGGPVKFMLEQLSQATAYVKTSDVVNYSLRKTIDACHTDPNLASAAAQKDCGGRIALLEAEAQSLERRQEVDKGYLTAQAIYYQQLNHAKREMLQLRQGEILEPKADQILSPDKLK